MIRNHFKVFFTRPEILLAIAIILVSGLITYAWNVRIYGLYQKNSQMDGNTIFILSHVVGNGIMLFLAPFVSAMPAYVFQNNKPQKNWLMAIDSAVYGGLIFVIAYSVSYVICIVMGGIHVSTDIGYLLTAGLFPGVFHVSPYLYSLCFIIHSFIFGCVYGVFGLSLLSITQNDGLALSLTIASYYLPVCFVGIFARIPFLSDVIPLFTFEVAYFSVRPVVRFGQLAVIMVISIILLVLVKKKRQQTLLEAVQESELD